MKDRHDETTFVNCTPKVLRVTSFVEVHVMSEPEDEQANCNDETCNDYKKCVLNTTYVRTFVLRLFLSRFGSNIRLLIFHNCLNDNELKLC